MNLRTRVGALAPRAVVLASAVAGCLWALLADTAPHATAAAAGCVAAAAWFWLRPGLPETQARVGGVLSAVTSALLLVGLQGGGHSPFVPVWLALVAGESLGAQQSGALAAAEAVGALAGLLGGGVSLGLIPLVGGFAGVTIATSLTARTVRAELRRAQAQADSDPLTGLANRWAIDRHLQGLLGGARTARIACLAVDLDDFRTINREHGHDAGDRAIAAAAARMRDALPDAAIARLGGDEFLVVLDGKLDPPTVARRLGEAVASAPIEGRTVTASIGVAWTPEHGASWEQLRKAADDALRSAKASGKSRAVVYSGETFDDPYEAVQALWQENRIRILVQPIVDLATGNVRAYEALARFAVNGDGSPLRWFRMATRAGLRAELELACLERALALAQTRPHGTRFSVNLSPEILERDEVRALLEAQGDLKGLVLEVTENGVVEDYERLQVLLEPLYERGLVLAVDDFGAGRANMHHVTALRPRFLKIDRSLVSDLDREPQKVALIEALARYAERIGSYLVAEGVERRGELEQLVAIGVTLAQGYYLATPGPPWPQPAVELAPARQPKGVESPSETLVVPVPASTRALELYERLAKEPGLIAFAVVDRQNRVLGLITRNALLLKLSARFGFSLYGERPAIQVADREFVFARADTPRPEIIARALARPRPSRFDPIVVLDERDEMRGYLTMESLLEEAALRAAPRPRLALVD